MTQAWAISASHLSGHPGVMLQEMQETQFDQSPAGILHTKAGREKASCTSRWPSWDGSHLELSAATTRSSDCAEQLTWSGKTRFHTRRSTRVCVCVRVCVFHRERQREMEAR